MSGESAGIATLLARAAGMSANAIARLWLLELAGPRRWHDTHESMFARAGKAAAINPRRVRAIVNQERNVRVSGDEILAIQRALAVAAETMEKDRDLARAAAALADSAALGAERERLRDRAEAIARQWSAPGSVR